MNSNLSYSPETPNLGQICRFLAPCDLEIWRMTFKNNRATLLSNIKLYVSFHHHLWIQTGVTVRKRLRWIAHNPFSTTASISAQPRWLNKYWWVAEVFHTPPCPVTLLTWQSIKEWPKLGLGSSLVFWVVETVDSAITSTWLVVLSQKAIDTLNSYGQLLFDKDITLTIVLSITILQNKQNASCFATMNS